MKPVVLSAFLFAGLALAGAPVAENESDYILRSPLNTSAALNGNMFTNQTEILTPRGIVDEPSTRMLLQQQPAAGPDDNADETPEPIAAMPEISPPTANSTMLSPTTISPTVVSPTQSAA